MFKYLKSMSNDSKIYEEDELYLEFEEGLLSIFIFKSLEPFLDDLKSK